MAIKVIIQYDSEYDDIQAQAIAQWINQAVPAGLAPTGLYVVVNSNV